MELKLPNNDSGRYSETFGKPSDCKSILRKSKEITLELRWDKHSKREFVCLSFFCSQLLGCVVGFNALHEDFIEIMKKKVAGFMEEAEPELVIR